MIRKKKIEKSNFSAYSTISEKYLDGFYVLQGFGLGLYFSAYCTIL